ncbi:partial Aspartate/prephenate aminotransferase, partial [Patescibacteria group bacterium]
MDTRLAQRTLNISSFHVMDLLSRAKQLEAQGKDVIHMEIGEPDFQSPSNIVNAGIKQLQ